MLKPAVSVLALSALINAEVMRIIGPNGGLVYYEQEEVTHSPSVQSISSGKGYVEDVNYNDGAGGVYGSLDGYSNTQSDPSDADDTELSQLDNEGDSGTDPVQSALGWFHDTTWLDQLTTFTFSHPDIFSHPEPSRSDSEHPVLTDIGHDQSSATPVPGGGAIVTSGFLSGAVSASLVVSPSEYAMTVSSEDLSSTLAQLANPTSGVTEQAPKDAKVSSMVSTRGFNPVLVAQSLLKLIVAQQETASLSSSSAVSTTSASQDNSVASQVSAAAAAAAQSLVGGLGSPGDDTGDLSNAYDPYLSDNNDDGFEKTYLTGSLDSAAVPVKQGGKYRPREVHIKGAPALVNKDPVLLQSSLPQVIQTSPAQPAAAQVQVEQPQRSELAAVQPPVPQPQVQQTQVESTRVAAPLNGVNQANSPATEPSKSETQANAVEYQPMGQLSNAGNQVESNGANQVSGPVMNGPVQANPNAELNVGGGSQPEVLGNTVQSQVLGQAISPQVSQPAAAVLNPIQPVGQPAAQGYQPAVQISQNYQPGNQINSVGGNGLVVTTLPAVNAAGHQTNAINNYPNGQPAANQRLATQPAGNEAVTNSLAGGGAVQQPAATQAINEPANQPQAAVPSVNLPVTQPANGPEKQPVGSGVIGSEPVAAHQVSPSINRPIASGAERSIESDVSADVQASTMVAGEINSQVIVPIGDRSVNVATAVESLNPDILSSMVAMGQQGLADTSVPAAATVRYNALNQAPSSRSVDPSTVSALFAGPSNALPSLSVDPTFRPERSTCKKMDSSIIRTSDSQAILDWVTLNSVSTNTTCWQISRNNESSAAYPCGMLTFFMTESLSFLMNISPDEVNDAMNHPPNVIPMLQPSLRKYTLGVVSAFQNVSDVVYTPGTPFGAEFTANDGLTEILFQVAHFNATNGYLLMIPGYVDGETVGDMDASTHSAFKIAFQLNTPSPDGYGFDQNPIAAVIAQSWAATSSIVHGMTDFISSINYLNGTSQMDFRIIPEQFLPSKPADQSFQSVNVCS